MTEEEKLARALHELDCVEADEDERRAGRTPPEKWADPWHPSGCGVNQQKLLYLRAERLRAALHAAGLVVVPAEPTEAMIKAASVPLNELRLIKFTNDHIIATHCYRAMIRAATPPKGDAT